MELTDALLLQFHRGETSVSVPILRLCSGSAAAPIYGWVLESVQDRRENQGESERQVQELVAQLERQILSHLPEVYEVSTLLAPTLKELSIP